MFFFGAFSGNLLYLILAISYLAGCSAVVFRSSEDQTKENKTSEKFSDHVLGDYLSTENAAFYYTIDNKQADQALLDDSIARPPSTFYPKTLYIPPLLHDESNFSGSALFSRPPPLFLAKIG